MLTRRHRYAVSFRVQQPADLGQLAVSLDHVLDAGGLHQKRVVPLALHHALHAFVVGRHKHVRPGRFHERPHPLVRDEVRVLRRENDTMTLAASGSYSVRRYLQAYFFLRDVQK